MQEIRRLLEIMTRLRDPEGGCPWDVEQDFASIAPYTLEEAYEVADAIERGDMADLQEELGDLLLQVVFHAQMAKEAGLFHFEDVARGINEKMIRRHPHVKLPLPLGEAAERSDAEKGRTIFDARPLAKVAGALSSPPNGRDVHTAADQTENWDKIKQQEKQAKGHASLLDDIPLNFPALLRAQKLTKKAAKAGFDWPSIEPVFEKLEEEIAELKEAIQKGDSTNAQEELGDILFVCTNLARHIQADAETALRGTNAKFEKRFRYIEQQLAAQGRSLEDASLEEMDALWDEAKRLPASHS